MSIPLAILGGYLGAGKTTLVNRLLREPHGARLTVLVNDLGKVNIDAGLIANHDGTTLTLTNGCACCQLQEDLTSQLMMLVVDSHPPDAVLVEASGAGEPARLALACAGVDGLLLTGVFVVADSTSLPQKRHDKFVGKLVTRQLAQADLILLSKTDIMPDGGKATRALIASLTDAPIINTARIDNFARLLLTSPQIATQSRAGQSLHPLEPETVNAGHVFEHIYFAPEHPLDIAALETLLDVNAGKLARAKGHTGTHRLQLVDNDWKLTLAVPASPQLVFIAVRGSCDLGALENELKKAVLVGPAGLEPATKPL